jgi:hypothetical protein
MSAAFRPPFLRLPAFALALGALAPGVASAGVTTSFEETYAASAEVRVTLENFNGSIVVHTWDRPEVKLAAVKRARDAEELAAIEVRVEARPHQLTIETVRHPLPRRWWVFSRPNTGAVDYTLTVPVGAQLRTLSTFNGNITATGTRGRVHLKTTNGRIALHDAAGEIHLEGVNSAIRAELAAFGQGHDLKCTSVNGAIKIVLPADASADVALATVNGGIRTDFDLAAETTGTVRKRLQGAVGTGAGQLEARTVNGGIDLVRAP